MGKHERGGQSVRAALLIYPFLGRQGRSAEMTDKNKRIQVKTVVGVLTAALFCVLLSARLTRSGNGQDTENGEAHGGRETKEIRMPDEDEAASCRIRVLIKTSAYAQLLHETVAVTADCGFAVCFASDGAERTERYSAGEAVLFTPGSDCFARGSVRIAPEEPDGRLVLQSVSRSQGMPAYRGALELFRTADGIAVVNELSLEEYLYSVVPSEMPAGYPFEALKAQAVCARTYAYSHMQSAAYPEYGAHVDDSTAFQVYNNVAEQESTTAAVNETCGLLLFTPQGEAAETFYYSTSCGIGSDANVWKTKTAPTLTYLKAKEIGTASRDGEAEASPAERLREESEFVSFIQEKNDGHFEADEGWYRWRYEGRADAEKIAERMRERYAADDGLILTWDGTEFVSRQIGRIGSLTDVFIAKRGAGGVADELILETETGSFKVISEYNIRFVLCDGETVIERQDGSTADCPRLLPSAFFVITVGKKEGNVLGYTLTGGGFGHGVGMSQNAAKRMAAAGWSAADILSFFYEDCCLKKPDE